MNRQTTMQDIANMAGVSRMTVSRALRKNSSISQEKRADILRIAKKMNYIPNQLAGSLSAKQSGFVAALLPSLNNLHFALTVQSLTTELEKIGLQLILGYTNYSSKREEEIIETMLKRRPQAIVVSYDGHTQNTIKLLKNAHIPIIEIWEKPKKPIDYTVGFSNYDVAYDMTCAIIERGFEHITFVGEELDNWTRGAQRRNGFIQAMQDHGLNHDTIVQYGKPPLLMENGAYCADIMLKKFPETQCVFSVSDIAAFGVQTRLQQLGYHVPNDFSIVGFGNFEISRFALPNISTVVVDPISIGYETGALIARILNDDSKAQPSACDIIFRPALEFRDSCADLR